jgi:osmotically-inducible protein OsmY
MSDQDYGRQGWSDSSYDRDYGWQGGRSGRMSNRDYGWQGQSGSYAGSNYGRQGQSGRMSNRDYGWQGQSGSRFNQQETFEEPTSWSYTEFWLIPGPFTGRGPQGYQRSKETIQEDVCERLTQHGQLDASQIQVDVNENCEVTLTGTVDSRQAKWMAEDVVESIWGVTDVHNQLRVQEQQDQKQQDQKQEQDQKSRQNQQQTEKSSTNQAQRSKS